MAAGRRVEEARRGHAEIADRIARDAGRTAQLHEVLPGLEADRAQAAARVAGSREERRLIDERIAEAAQLRNEWEVRSAGLAERRRVLTERLHEVDRRLTGHADERREAAERRERLEADATAVERLSAVVATAQARLDGALAELRERYRPPARGGTGRRARLEELRHQRSAMEHQLVAARTRIQAIELDLVEATIRRESVIEALRHELGLRAR